MNDNATASTLAMFAHQDGLESLNSTAPLAEKLSAVHAYVRQQVANVDRISIALYDAGTDVLKTYAHSSESKDPLPLYEARLAEAHSLHEMIERRQPRLVSNLELLQGSQEHTRKIRHQGFGSSYTLPMYHQDEFVGILFFNSLQANAFDERALHYLDLIGHLISLLVIDNLAAVRALVASVRTATALAHHRDLETGCHLDRMAHYCRIIARELAPQYHLDDTAVEDIFLFSPLHDIGKIAIPDDILFKKGELDDDEFEIMKTHTTKGELMIESMIENFHFVGVQHIDVLRNIALYHHEAMNGSGYPCGLAGDQIPVEARIAAVADAFDALTSARSYKPAWSNEQALAKLNDLADSKFDRDCVNALQKRLGDVEEIQRRFQEDQLG